MPKLTDAELIAAIEQEERQSIDSHSGELHQERVDALARYRGELLGNEIDGRSQVVDMTMLDTIESLMPGLVSTFLGGEDLGQFEPRGPDDVEPAKVETDVVNWCLNYKNDLFSQVNACLRDALLLKNGYIVAFWQTKTETVVETYNGLSDEEVTLLSQDKEIEIVEHSEYPDPMAPSGMSAGALQAFPAMGPDMGGANPPATLHDVKIQRKKADEFAGIEAVPPDELLVSRRHRSTSLVGCDFTEWVRRAPIYQLREEGFDIPDDVPGDDEFTQEWAERQRFNEQQFIADETGDKTRRVVTFRDAYIVMDYDGTGAKLWRVARVSGWPTPALVEEADIVPFAAFSPIIYPHSHIGSSIYDQTKDTSLVKLTLRRQLLDGVYQLHNGEKVVNVDMAMSLDDWLVDRPGAVRRVQGNPAEAVMYPSKQDNSPSILQALQYMDEEMVRRTGIQTNAPNGLNSNALNNSTTATAVQAMQSQSGQRSELIARTLVSGFRDLFVIVHALMQKHSTKPIQLKLNDKWTMVNPREWSRRSDFKVNVGLGSGNPQMKMGALHAMGPIMAQAMQMGLAGPTEAYNYGCEMWKAAGYPVYERFLHPAPTDPQTGQPKMPPPQPPPEVQVAQMKMQGEGQKLQQEGQIKMHELQLQDQIKQRELASQQAVQQSNDQRDAQKSVMDAQLRREQMQAEMQQRDIEHARAMQSAERIALINAASKVEVARIGAGQGTGENMVLAASKSADLPNASDVERQINGVRNEVGVALTGMHHSINKTVSTMGQQIGQHLGAIHQHIDHVANKPLPPPPTQPEHPEIVARNAKGKVEGKWKKGKFYPAKRNSDGSVNAIEGDS